MSITEEQIEYALNHHAWMSYNQAKLIMTMVNERFEADSEERETYRALYKAVNDHASFEELLRRLKVTSTLAQKEAAAERARIGAEREAARVEAMRQRPTEEGLYRNPETGELYRLKKDGNYGAFAVSKYSNTAIRRRLTTDNEIVKKGTWKKLGAYDSRRHMLIIKKDWKMSQDDMVAYKYGICLFCYRGLEDAVSVAMNYGPVCAKGLNLPWSEEAAEKLGYKIEGKK